MKWIINGLLLNIGITAMYYLYQVSAKKNRNKAILVSMIMISCPLIAPAYLMLSWISYKLISLFGSQSVDLSSLSFSKEKTKPKTSSDIMANVNKVPLEEVLLVESTKNRRDGFLAVLKEDALGSVDMIKQAVHDYDSEISHYAASALMDIIEQYSQREKTAYARCQSEPTSEHKAEYVDVVTTFLQKDLLSRVEKLKLMERLEQEMQLYSDYDIAKVGSVLLAKVGALWGSADDSIKANYWLQEAFHTNQYSLETYKIALVHYYTTKQVKEFKSLLATLKRSNLVIDHETLEWIRFFQI